MSDMKQVIVIRKDLNMRKGKIAAQAAHASMAAIIHNKERCPTCNQPEEYLCIKLTPEISQWLNGTFTKVVVCVDSEEELLEVYDNAQNANLHRSIIKDLGKTEFHGNHTYTAVAIGPGLPEEIDKITGHLKLL